jgi:WD40 repeat protein
MKVLRLTILVAATLLGVGAPAGGHAAIAEEAYRRTSLYEEGIGVSSIVFSQDGARVAFAIEGRKVRIRETATGNEIASIAVPSSLDGSDDDYIHFVAFSPDGTRLVTASRDKMVRVWDIGDGRALAVLKHPSVVRSARFSPDGTRLATDAGNTMVHLWDVAEGRELTVLDHSSAVDSTVFSPEGGRLLAACIDGTAHLWDVASGSEIMVLQGHTKAVRDARFSPDGARVVTASADGTARIWDAASGRELLAFGHAAPVLSAAFSPDGTRIVTGAGAEAHVFDAAVGREIAVLRGHENDVIDASFSPDGRRIVTASDDRSVRIWDAASGAEVAVLSGSSYGVEFAAFSPDGERIFTVGGAQAIIWSKLAPASLPEGLAGLWFADPATPEQPVPPEFIRAMCVAEPIKIDGNGLIVLFEGAKTEPPHAVLHLRCASDLTCEIFSGAPAQTAEKVGDGTLSVSAGTGSLCLTGQCNRIARCPELVWTDEERSSGFADRWQASVQAPQQ